VHTVLIIGGILAAWILVGLVAGIGIGRVLRRCSR